jgi:hypothetical protein
VAGSCEYGDEPSGSGTTELVSDLLFVHIKSGPRSLITCYFHSY